MSFRFYSLSIISGFLISQAGIAFSQPKTAMLAKEQVINIGNGEEPKTLDPQKCNETACSTIVRQLFEGLISADENGKIVPALAESWKINNDAKVYTFYLRKNLKWSDGSHITAKDFVYSFQRLVDPKIASEQASLLEFVVNAKEIMEGKKQISTLGVRSLNDSTFEVTLQTPMTSFLENLTVANTSPVQQKNIEKYGEAFTHVENLVSNGPFKLAFRKVGDKVTVERNKNYWNSKDVHIEKANFYSIVDQNSEYNMYEAGQIDILKALPINQYKNAKLKYPNELKNEPILSAYFYMFNLNKSPFNNKKLRQALSIAIDRNVIANSVTAMGQKPLYDVVPYGIKNYSHNKIYWQDWPRAKQIEEAKKLYKEAGYSEQKPLTVHILYNTMEGHKKIAAAIASMWKKDLGVNAITENEEWKTMLDRRQNGDFEVLRMGSVANINDPSDFLVSYRSTDPSNTPKYKNLEFDKMVNQGLIEMDLKKRKSFFEKAGKLMMEDQPISPIYSYVSSYMVKPYVVGFKLNPLEKFTLVGVYIAAKKQIN